MYRLTRFGAFNLERFNQVEDVGSGATPTSYFSLVEGGALDNFGGQQKHPGAVERTKSLRLHGKTLKEVSDLYFQLLALRGTRAPLVRRLYDNSEHWQYARLVEVTAQRTYEKTKFRFFQDVELRFVCQETFWHGAIQGAWFINDGHFFNTGLYLNDGDATIFDIVDNVTNISLTVGSASDAGRAVVRDAVITIVIGDEPADRVEITDDKGTSLSIASAEQAIELGAGAVILIDTGTMQVTVDGNDAYANLTFTPASNDAMYWFALNPGNNQIRIDLDGGGEGSKIGFSFSEAWY